MKYYLIKTKENCDIGNCGGTKNVLDIYSTNFVELTEKEIKEIINTLQNDGEFEISAKLLNEVK